AIRADTLCLRTTKGPAGMTSAQRLERSFDAALFFDVIEHLAPRVEVLREIFRVLKDDGRLLVSGPNRETRWRRTLRAPRGSSLTRIPTTRSSTRCRNSWPSWPPPGSSPTVR